jgi:hypothetical protein
MVTRAFFPGRLYPEANSNHQSPSHRTLVCEIQGSHDATDYEERRKTTGGVDS